MKIRKLVSLIAFLSFVVMSFTGIVLFLAPQSRVAYWTGWELFGLSKRDYDAVHSTFMVLFVSSLVWHTVFNWKSLIDYLRDQNKKLKVFTFEFCIAVGLCVVFFVGTVYRVIPFEQYLDVASIAKRYWARTEGTPLWAPADATSLERFCRGMEGVEEFVNARRITIDPDEAVAALRRAGIEIDDSSMRMDEIAGANATTPQQLAEVVMTVARPVVEISRNLTPE